MAQEKGKRWIKKDADLALLAVRVMFVLFMIHGVQKLMALDGIVKFFGSLGIPAPGVMAPFIAVLEAFGGLALALGIWTEYIGPLIALDMGMAILLTKAGAMLSKGLPLSLTSMEVEFGYLIAALAVTLAGAGKYSLEEWLRKK